MLTHNGGTRHVGRRLSYVDLSIFEIVEACAMPSHGASGFEKKVQTHRVQSAYILPPNGISVNGAIVMGVVRFYQAREDGSIGGSGGGETGARDYGDRRR